MHPEAARALRRTCLPACSLLVSSVPCSLHANLTASPQAEHHHSHCRILIVRCPFDTHQIKIFDREETAVWAHIPSETASSYAMKLCWVVCVMCLVSVSCGMYCMWYCLKLRCVIHTKSLWEVIKEESHLTLIWQAEVSFVNEINQTNHSNSERPCTTTQKIKKVL